MIRVIIRSGLASAEDGGPGDFDARSDWAPGLLIATGAPVTFAPGHPVFARALAVGLITNFSRGSDGMAVAGFAGLLVGDGPFGIAEIAFLAVMAMPAGGVVFTFQAHSTGYPTG